MQSTGVLPLPAKVPLYGKGRACMFRTGKAGLACSCPAVRHVLANTDANVEDCCNLQASRPRAMQWNQRMQATSTTRHTWRVACCKHDRCPRRDLVGVDFKQRRDTVAEMNIPA
eukprot:scaffold314090_cov17-Tisochrysis_lutea.AAC.1